MTRALHPGRGPHDPATSTPPRRPGSVRRTTTHDSHRPDGLGGAVALLARGRDLRTGPDGQATVLDSAELTATIEDALTRRIGAIAAEPGHPGMDELVGARASSGFRRAVDAALPGERGSHSVRFQLLDDLPTASLVGGYALLVGGAVPPRRPTEAMQQQADLCAGWVTGGTFLTEMVAAEQTPVPIGPVVAALEPDDDPLAWHETEPLGPHGMRRRRRLDVWTDDDAGVAVECFFRDSHVGPDGLETVVHEYTVHASVDPSTLRFTTCEAVVGVLPWRECPGAAASAGRLVGAPADGLRRWVRDTFVGPPTCTHLNDTLRSLEDLPALVAALPDARTG